MDQITFREVSARDTGQVDDLVSESFGYSPPHRYFDDFPVWSAPGVLRLGGYSGNRLVSHVGIHFRNVRSGGTRTPVALIGAVATLESFRGRGLVSSLMRLALSKADLAGCTWSLLWGSEHDFYAKFGFKLSGTQARARLATLSPAGFRTFNPNLEIHSGLCQGILDDFQNRTTGIEFTPSDREWLARQTTVTWESIKEPFAFIGYGRGMDLKGMVHETGGDPAGIRELLIRLMNRNPEAEMIGAEHELLGLGFKSETLVLEGLCLARPRNDTIEWNQDFWISGLGAV